MIDGLRQGVGDGYEWGVGGEESEQQGNRKRKVKYVN